MMTRDEAVAVIQARLGFRTDLVSTIELDLRLAQQELEQEGEKPWFLFREVPLVNVGGAIALPERWLGEPEPGHLWILDSAGEREAPLQRDDWHAIMRARHQGLTHYDVVGGEIRLGPTAPEEVLNFEYHYWRGEPELTSDVENGWLKEAPEVLIGLAGAKTAGALHDDRALQVFGAMLNAARRRLDTQTNHRMNAAKNHVMRYSP